MKSKKDISEIITTKLEKILTPQIEQVVSRKIDETIIRKLDIIEQEIKEVRQKDIPGIKIDVAVVKTESTTSAKIIAGIGGLIAVATSAAIAYFH